MFVRLLVKIALNRGYIAWLALLVIMVCAAWQLCAQPTRADQGWVINVSTKQFDDYLRYDGSQLQPFVKASISYSQETGSGTQSGNYEDLYFGNYHAIGCMRHQVLDITAGTEGEIRLKTQNSGNLASGEAYAAANSAGRLVLDAMTKRCWVKWVKVPYFAFDDVVAAFSKTGFHIYDPSLTKDQPSTFILLVVSDPPGKTQHVAF